MRRIRLWLELYWLALRLRWWMLWHRNEMDRAIAWICSDAGRAVIDAWERSFYRDKTPTPSL